MKSLEIHLLGLYTALLTDVGRYYPRDAIEWKRDHSRLRLVMEARGSKFFTIDLVACGKHFDKCLSTRTFLPSRLPYQKGRKKGSVIPGLFQGLLTKVFLDDGTLRDDVDVTAVSLLRQLYYAAKKVRHDCDSSATFKVTKDFFDIESEIQPPTYSWDADDLGDIHPARIHLNDRIRAASPMCDGQATLDLFGPSVDSQLHILSPALDVVQRLADLLSGDLGEIPWSAVVSKHGPGAVSDHKKGASKYSFPNWPWKLELEFPAVGFALSSESLWSDVQDGGYPILSRNEPPSKLIAVPKTQKAPRLIASEPTAHQWMQQGVRAALLERYERTLLRRSIHFRDQTYSQQGALRASALASGCTIDLSSASDRLSCWTVERMFRKNSSLLRALHSTRTRWLVNPIDKKLPQYLILKKFAPMGSALTFPVQSIVYAIVSIACTMIQAYGTKRLLASKSWQFRSWARNASGSVIVFGDDLIVPEHSYPLVSEVLSYLGLKVNPDKTFVGGSFYESCGVDAYCGVNVTPQYFLQYPVESDPSSIASAVECSNNFHKGGLWATAAWLTDSIPRRFRTFLGIDRVGDGRFGLKSFYGNTSPVLMERWNDDLHRWEQLRLILLAKTSRKPDHYIGSLLQWFTEDPGPDIIWSSGIVSRGEAKLRKAWVESGLLQT